MGLSRSQIKMIRSLGEKKNRDELGLFVAEGEKIVGEILEAGYPVEVLIVNKTWTLSDETFRKNIKEMHVVEEATMSRLSQLSTPSPVLAVCPKRKNETSHRYFHSHLSLLLDEIQDPGNVGTILRIADWFGISQLVCSPHTADMYNPKVIQASMGAFLRVSCLYTSPEEFLSGIAAPGYQVYGTFTEGQSIYHEKLSTAGLIILGNESRGISKSLYPYITSRLSVPRFPAGHKGAESLNVAVAAGIVCAEFRRRQITTAP